MGSVQHEGAARPERLRVVVVAQPNPYNQLILTQLADRVRLERVLFAVAPPNPPHSLAWALERLRTSPFATAAKPVRNLVLNKLDAQTTRRLRDHLPPAASAVIPAAEPLPYAEVTGAPMVELLTGVAPDLMILSGAPLLKPAVFTLPRLGTVNVHWGIAPDHRGQQSLFNALRLGDYAAIGATIHYLDEGIDTGLAIAQVRPALDPADDLASIWAKTAVLVASTLGEFVEQLELGPVPGRRLTGDGVLFRNRDRRVRHHLTYGVERRLGRRRPPRTEAQVTRYW